MTLNMKNCGLRAAWAATQNVGNLHLTSFTFLKVVFFQVFKFSLRDHSCSALKAFKFRLHFSASFSINSTSSVLRSLIAHTVKSCLLNRSHYGKLQSTAVNCGPLRSTAVNCGQLWSTAVKFGYNCGQLRSNCVHLRSTAVNCGQLRSTTIYACSWTE